MYFSLINCLFLLTILLFPDEIDALMSALERDNAFPGFAQCTELSTKFRIGSKSLQTILKPTEEDLLIELEVNYG